MPTGSPYIYAKIVVNIQDRDLKLLKEIVKTRLNMEMAPTQEMLKMALDISPDCVTLVPERREEVTTEGGLDVSLNYEKVEKYVTMLREAGMEVSLFIDPDPDQIRSGHRIGVNCMEINTARYCEANTEHSQQAQLNKLIDAAKVISRLNIKVSAGHGLHPRNVSQVAAIKEIEEFNIGHSIVARAVIVGFHQAVCEMLPLVKASALKV